MEYFKNISDESMSVNGRVPFCVSGLEIYLNGTTENLVDSNSRDAAELGTFTGVAVAVFMKILFSLKNNFSETILQNLRMNNPMNSRALYIFVILTTLIFLPVLFSLSILALIYKFICTLLIQRIDKSYAGLLDSFDVFWSLEDDSSKSIINVFGIIESESPQALASSVKDKLKSVINEDNKNMEKIFYRRSERFGFYYWRRYMNVDLNEYVHIVRGFDKNDVLDENYLQELMAEHSEKPLPYDDEGLFQILITGSPVNVKKSGANLKESYGLIIKIHHSLSDGVALLEFLCQTLADSNPNSGIFTAFHKQKQNSPRKLVDKICTLIQMPVCLVKGIIRKPDDNALHGPALTGNKVFVWTHSKDNLLQMMNDLKESIEGVKYTDLLVTALSAANEESSRRSVILPIRFPERAGDCLKLENNFSVTILDVPVQNTSNDAHISLVKTRCDQLRSSADPITNYYFLMYACGVLPSGILKPMLVSKQATMVLSNLPGPGALTICGGNKLKQLVFFVPNKGTTGVGVTALSYNGALRLAASADRALVSGADELRLILDGMVDEISRLHREHCAPRQ